MEPTQSPLPAAATLPGDTAGSVAATSLPTIVRSAYAGAGLLAFGSLLPFMRAPIIGSPSAFALGVGKLTLVLAIVAAVLIHKQKLRWLWAPGLLSAWVLFRNWMSIERSAAELRNSLFGAFGARAELAWGFWVLIGGTGLLLYAAHLATQAARDRSTIGPAAQP